MRGYRLLLRLLADRRGVSLIEFGFVAPILCLLLVGILDFGMGLWDQMQVANAAEAGEAYAAVHGWSTTATNIETAVTSATPLGSNVTFPSTPQIITCGSVPPVGPCANGGSGSYWQIATQYTYSTILPWPGITSPLALSATTYARLYP